MPIGTIALIIVSVLVFFGLGHRILDRMRLSDKGALIVIALMVVGSFITIPLIRGRIGVDVNIGGALVPLGLAVYVLSKAGTAKEWVRALGAALAVGILLSFTDLFIGGSEPESMFIDPLYFYPLAAGIVAYVISRSRRSAFIAGALGILLFDLGTLISAVYRGVPAFVSFGGGGAFDSVVIAGLVAALLAEIVGETRERLQGGPAHRGRPEELKKGLSDVQFANALGAHKNSVAGTDREPERGGADHEEK
ncbi:MAG: DUF1614 domain-containing protein [Clostridia bacterium]|nr:DUF1614 domain-containing protein [Clostridia bacterium]